MSFLDKATGWMPAPWRQRLGLVALLLIGVALGGLLFGGSEGPPAGDQKAEHASHDHAPSSAQPEEVWTCSMHPQVRLPADGPCPICFMDLIPAEVSALDEKPTELRLSEAAKALAEVRTAPARRAEANRELSLVGRVTYDETLVQRVSSFVPGRIERLYVEVTGTRVKRGEHLLRIYSPELLAAQTEWLDALKQAKRMPAGTAARNVLDRTAAGAEERLRLWGLSKGQLAKIRQNQKPQERITIFSPRSGVVVERSAVVGMYVKEGSPLYTVAELDRLWVELDAFESDLPHVRFGQTVELKTDAMPGRTWKGRVSFVSPIVDERTRTVRVRVNFDNEDGALKPGMMVRAALQASVDEHGHAVGAADLAGAYVCPMHPDVVKHGAGRCDVCGMSLVPAEELGLVGKVSNARPLLIPASAPLLTGKRAVVYVEVEGRDQPTYEGRVVVLGPRVGNDYVVVDGLVEGELVAVEGAFKLDAAMQVQARPSMMSLPGEEGAASRPASQLASPPGDNVDQDEDVPFRPGQQGSRTVKRANPRSATSGGRPAKSSAVDLQPALTAYVALEDALSKDDLASAKSAAGRMKAAAPPGALVDLSGQVATAADIAGARKAFVELSKRMIVDVERTGAPPELKLYKFFCPMADQGKGAEWLQKSPQLTNPYFGSRMLKCGESRGAVKSAAK